MSGRACLLAVVAALLLAPAPAGAALSPIPRDGWVPDGAVSDVVELPGGDLLVGGSFRRWTPATGSLVRVDARSGALRLGGLPVVAGGAVLAVEPDGTGGWFLGGSFRYVGGLPRAGLAHVLPSGQLDRAFHVDVESWDGRRTQPGTVQALRRVGGTLYVGGTFVRIGGHPSDGLAAVQIRGTGVLPAWRPHLDGPVQVLAAAPDAIYVAGPFAAVNGQVRTALAALDPVSGELLPFDAHVDGKVSAVLVDGDRLVVVGYLLLGGPDAYPTGVAAFDRRSGALEPWAPAIGTGANAVARASGGYVLGVRNGRDGAVTLVDAASGAVRWSTPVRRGSVNALTVDGDRVLVAGDFHTAGGRARVGAAVLALADGAVRRWNARLAIRIDIQGGAGVRAIVPTRGGVLLGGDIGGAGGVERHNLAVLDRATLRPTSRRVDVEGAVTALAVLGRRVYVAGPVDGGPRFFRPAVALDARTLRRVRWTPPRIDGSAYDIAAIGDRIVVTGGFNGVRATRVHGSFAAFRPDTGALVDGFGPRDLVGNGVGEVREADGRVWALGGFAGEATTLAQLSPTTGAVVRIPIDNADSGGLSAFEPAGPGTAYVGGSVIRIGRTRVAHIAKVDLRSGRVLPWGGTIGRLGALDDSVADLQRMPGALVVAGYVTMANGQPRTGLAAFSPAGHLLPWDPHPDRAASRLRRIGSELVALGDFTGLGARPQAWFAVFAPA